MPLRRALMLLPLALAGLWFALRFGALPEPLATSFDFSGKPQDTMGRTGFAVLALVTLACTALFFGGLALWLPTAPAAWVNLPEKEYWLAPERRVATMARLGVFLDVLGLALCTMLALLFVAIGEHAIAGGGQFSAGWLVVPVLLLVFTACAIVWLDRPFRARRRELRAHAR